MNASLPGLPLATDSAGAGAGLGGELQGIQGDSVDQAGFAPLLEQAYAAISVEAAAVPPGSPDAEGLVRQIQGLPQAGKLLPLLAQVLDEAGTNGIEPQQVLQHLAEKLRQPGSNDELHDAAGLVATLHQLLGDLPALKAPVAADAGAGVFVSVEGRISAASLAGERPSGHSSLPVLQRQTGVAEAGVNGVPGDSNSNDPGRAPEQARLWQPQSWQPEPRQAELASVIATLKRLTVQGKSEHPDTQPRTEPVTTAVTSPSVQGSSPATPVLATLSVNTPLAQGNWDQALGERIQWMVSQKMQGAQIRLNPAQLGPMEVRIQVHNDQASIQFSSAHSMVREALEAALPRLRDMFDASGVELVEVDVSGHSSANEQRAGADGGAVKHGTGVIDSDSGAETLLETPVNALLENGRLDLFA
jgi:hypothetical protein